jgi:hypothetical protein
MKHRDGSIEKAARLIVLMQMQDRGRLAGLSLQKIADLLPDKPHRSTIMRTLRDVDRLREILKANK